MERSFENAPAVGIPAMDSGIGQAKKTAVNPVLDNIITVHSINQLSRHNGTLPIIPRFG